MCKKCYVTTPIYYASGKVQIGNSYTTVACDVYARFNRQMGRKTFYLTGMDEHGQKIEEAASKAKMNPQTFVDKVALETKELWKVMHIDYDGFIRTTDKKHEEIVAKSSNNYLQMMIYILVHIVVIIAFLVKHFLRKLNSEKMTLVRIVENQPNLYQRKVIFYV